MKFTVMMMEMMFPYLSHYINKTCTINNYCCAFGKNKKALILFQDR